MKIKKILPILAATCLFAIPCCAQQTQRVGLVNFCELYTSRLVKLSNATGEEYGFIPGLSSIVMPSMDIDGYMVLIPAGIAEIYADNFEISWLQMRYVDLGETDDDTLVNNLYSFVTAVSALEYGSAYDTVYGNGFYAGHDLYNEEMKDKIDASTIVNIVNSEQLIYSGNYDYYMSYSKTTESESGVIYITARERSN